MYIYLIFKNIEIVVPSPIKDEHFEQFPLVLKLFIYFGIFNL